jgi:nucleoside-diphosphate-sugar epimerase
MPLIHPMNNLAPAISAQRTQPCESLPDEKSAMKPLSTASSHVEPAAPPAELPERAVPERIVDVEHLEVLLSTPTPAALNGLATLDSDLVILGVGGKMGPTLARMAARGVEQLGLPYRVYGVARFSQPGVRERLESVGVHTIACDLLNRAALTDLPDTRNVIFMAGQKFGTTGNQHMTWAINTYLPGLVCERYLDARIVAFSTGNFYALTPVVDGGSREEDEPGPIGEYASSCLGRERIFEYFSRTHGLRCALVRLSYAVEMRYGVLVDIARKVYHGEPIALEMGAANVIWQGDANAHALGLLPYCSAPPFTINVTGPETVSIRRAAEHFGCIYGKEPIVAGSPALTALLVNANKAHDLLGYPQVTLNRMMAWIADWVARGGASLNKPTHFETRDGRY